MSLDVPFYQELRRRGLHRIARWWALGDAMYMIGLAGGLLCIAAIPLSLLLAIFDVLGYRPAVGSLLGFLASGVVLVSGALIKSHSWRLGREQGVEVEEY